MDDGSGNFYLYVFDNKNGDIYTNFLIIEDYIVQSGTYTFTIPSGWYGLEIGYDLT